MPRILLFTLLLVALAACAPETPTEAPTPTVTVTYPAAGTLPGMALLTIDPATRDANLLIDQTFTPTITYTPSNTPTPSRTPTITRTPTRTRRPSATPTVTNTPRVHYDDMLLRIEQPGPMSKAVSPIRFIVFVAPEYTGLTRIELIGEDGREIYRKVLRTVNVRTFFRVSEDIPFEIPGAAEVARLQISTVDTNGQIMALKSVRMLLQSVGEELDTPAYEAIEPVALRFPKRNDEITGGAVYVEGEFRPLMNTPLILELVDDKGNILGSRILYFDTALNTYQIFNVSIPYKVTDPKGIPVRLVLRQSDDRIPGNAYIFTYPLKLKP